MAQLQKVIENLKKFEELLDNGKHENDCCGFRMTLVLISSDYRGSLDYCC